MHQRKHHASSRNSHSRPKYPHLPGVKKHFGRYHSNGYYPCIPFFGELTDDTPDMYAHYFISAQIYFEHTSFFLLRKPKTIVLAGGDNQPQLSGVPKLNIYQDEGSLIKDIHQLRQYGHQARKQAADKAMHIEKTEHELSVREIEVLILITKGLINKEIADKLNISLTTVISHRKNITEKLGIKSVSGLTVYAVMNGYIEADRI